MQDNNYSSMIPRRCLPWLSTGLLQVEFEYLRRAKQNDVSVLPKMWALLMDLLKVKQARARGEDSWHGIFLVGSCWWAGAVTNKILVVLGSTPMFSFDLILVDRREHALLRHPLSWAQLKTEGPKNPKHEICVHIISEPRDWKMMNSLKLLQKMRSWLDLGYIL